MLRQFIEWLESGERTAEDLRKFCLERIVEHDGSVRAWVEVAPRNATADGPLRGVPFGVKDVIETRDMATQYGSPLYAGRKGTEDAAIVADLRRSGAVLLGKTHTAAFASFDPPPTRNPRVEGHTPGGSSSGSAAAVAAGMVPFAVGTQTLGSVLRPASYCGVCGFKPSFGLLPMDGVLPFAPTLDTLGFFTADAADMQCLWTRSVGGPSGARLNRAAHFRVPAEPAMQGAITDAVERLRASGVEIHSTDPPPEWELLLWAARLINDYEGARTHAARFAQHGERIGRRLAELVSRGSYIPDEEYARALAVVVDARRELSRIFWEFPAILSPAATGPAPQGLESTGDPRNNAVWTLLGVPVIGVPLPEVEMPMSLQIAAAWGRDDALVAVAAHAAELLAGGHGSSRH